MSQKVAPPRGRISLRFIIQIVTNTLLLNPDTYIVNIKYLILGNISRMNFACPEGCKAYYAVNGDQLDLNEDKGTVDLKSEEEKKVHFILFFFHLSKISILSNF